MLVELAVRDLGVISDLRISFGPGMTALTGETGAGKTMIVEAVGLLCGGRADPSRVRAGAQETVVEGLFVDGDDVETVIRRIVPADGRSRCYVDGALVTAAALSELMAGHVEICGQHGSVRLAGATAQRDALDRSAGIDVGPWRRAVLARQQLQAQLEEMGGDARARARELDLLRYQFDELSAARLDDAGEDDRLDAEEDLLAGAAAQREAVAVALDGISGEGGIADQLAAIVAPLATSGPVADVADRLAGAVAELQDLGRELRDLGDAIVDDPARLEEIAQRRQLLRELRRKYGDTLADVLRYRSELGERIAELDSHDERARALEAQLGEALAAERVEALAVGGQRRAAAPALASKINERLAALAMSSARLAIEVGDDGDPAGERVEFQLGIGQDVPPGPLARVASGGELSRVLLALYLVLSGETPTLVFDEVDSGVGGATATAIGTSLASLARDRQVLVVTHLPQVAAAADNQMVVRRSDDGGVASSTLVALERDERVIELSRMLAGAPGSRHARSHADELLAASAANRRPG